MPIQTKRSAADLELWMDGWDRDQTETGRDRDGDGDGGDKVQGGRLERPTEQNREISVLLDGQVRSAQLEHLQVGRRNRDNRRVKARGIIP